MKEYLKDILVILILLLIASSVLYFIFFPILTNCCDERYLILTKVTFKEIFIIMGIINIVKIGCKGIKDFE